jgi:putative colanic acid biosynthesis acetyltransferase WcaF
MIIQGNNPFTQPSFSLKNRVMRQLWNMTWVLLFRPSPRPLHRWRACLLRLFGAQLGVNNHFYPAAKIWAPWNLRTQDHVLVGDGTTIYNMDMVQLNSFCIVSQGAHLCGGTHDFNSPNFQLYARPIVIGRRAWICAESFVGPGVTVADGVVVGARSVVMKSLLEPWTVHAGNPCRRIGNRQKHSED